MASFQELLEQKRKAFEGESDRVSIAEAGAERSSNVQANTEKEYAKIKVGNKSKFDNISSSVKGLPDALRQDIERLEDGSYQDLVRFFRKYDRLNEEVQGGRLYNKDEKDYIKETIKTVVDEMANLQGPVARAAFAFEDFKSQFKPLKLADRFLGDLPIIGDMIRDRLQTKAEADKMAKSIGLSAKKQNLKKERKDQKSSEGDISFGAGADTSSNLFNMSSDSVGDTLGNLAKNAVVGKGSEESQKEQANLRKRELNIFETIMQNTERTNELLEELTETTEENAGLTGGGSKILEALGIAGLFKGGKGLVGKVGKGAASLLGLKGLKNMFGKNKNQNNNNKKRKNKRSRKKGAGKAVGKFGKAALRGLKFIPGIGLVAAGGMGLYDGIKGFSADEDASFGEKLGNAGSSVLSGLTFGLLGKSPDEIAAEDELSGGDISQALDTSPDGVNKSKSQSVGLDQVFQINAEKVILKTNSMKQLQNENEVIRRAIETVQNGAVNNSVTNQVVNNAKGTFMGPRLTSTNPRNVVKSVF